MKKTGIVKKLFCIATFFLLAALPFQACEFTHDKPSPRRAVQKKKLSPTASKELRAIDKKISHTEKQIRDYEEFRTKRLHEAILNDAEHEASRGWVKLDGKPTYEDLATRAHADVAATEKEVTRLKNRLEKLGNQKQAVMRQSSGCFLPKTLVRMEDGSLKPFSKLQPGERVLTYDIGYDKLVNKQVVKVYSVKANHLYTINDQLNTSGGERLLTQDGWKKIRNLEKSDFIHLNGHMVKIENIDYTSVNQTLYNMQVADTHNFYVVTADGSNYLVHNSSGGHGGGGSGGGGDGGSK